MICQTGRLWSSDPVKRLMGKEMAREAAPQDHASGSPEQHFCANVRPNRELRAPKDGLEGASRTQAAFCNRTTAIVTIGG